jgi:alpha-D-xyloside xylohydrolase
LLSSNSDETPDEAAAARRSSVRVTNVEAFQASVTRRTNEWLVFFRIPWDALGGKPKSYFGLLPMRTRWRDGEFSTPVAFDINEALPVDLLIEAHLSGTARVGDAQDSLCQLPSGILRWQRTPALIYPNLDTCRQIWQLESSLSTPTDKNNLAQRLHLTQCWMDLMMLEGFTPLPLAQGNWVNDLRLPRVRQKVNAALQKNDLPQAYQLVDTYLGQLDKLSRWWYADGSPGDILKNEWKPVTRADSLEVQGQTLLMKCVAGGHPVDLRLALPTTGGVRIYGNDQGFFKPEQLLPLTVKQSSGSCTIATAGGTVAIQQNPFSVAFYDTAGKKVTQIGAADVAFRFGSDGTVLAVGFKNQLGPHEVIYGFGEKYTHFNENGQVLTLWVTDDWSGNGAGLANTTYKPLPIFQSSRGYMVFDNSSYRLRADLGKTDPDQYRITQQGPIFDYYFWIGSPEKSLASYTALTGRAPLPPKWAFEPWMGRGGGAWAEGPHPNFAAAGRGGNVERAVAEEESVTKRYAELDIPHSAIYAEGPSHLSPELNQFMAARGIRVMGWYMAATPPSEQQRLMPEVKPADLPYIRFADGNGTPRSDYVCVDFSNPHALELLRREFKPSLDLGEAGSMIDIGRIPWDSAVFYNGQHGSEMRNFYAYDCQRTISEVFREKRGDDFILFGGGAAPGTQRWVAQFAGDHPPNFNGLEHVLTGGLNLCACGYSTWGSDIGGYFGFPQPAVYMRWVQFGCFSPLMRLHGVAPRDPWFFGDAAVTNYKFLAWTRENILDYIYNAAAIAHDTGIPIMRSMPLAFPNQPQLAAVGDQYLFGPDLLVAPVMNERTFRTIVFPSGVWTSLWDGKTVTGPATLKVSAPLDTIPVYLKPGAVVPVRLNPDLQFGQSMTGSRVNALLVTPPNVNQTVSLLNSQGQTATVTVQSKADVMGWTVQNLSETSYLLVYGSTAASTVKLDGKVLPKLTATEFGSMPAGWEADLTGNRLVIRLPSRPVEPGEPTAEIEVDFNPNAK